ncbi:MAG: AMP-binding protein [Phycisphaerales bacterium]|nr:AMP-binding protein [Phycisphaerales bacterium]
MSIHWPIIRRCLARPTRIAAIDDNRSWKAAELVVAALHLAAEVERRSRTRTLGVMLPTGGTFPVAALAGWMLGKVVVPLNYLLKPEELAYVVKDCGTDTIVTAGPLLTHTGHTPRVQHLLKLDELKDSFRGFPEPRWPAAAADGDLAVILYTSGTSGRPKGVMLTHGNLSAKVRQLRGWVNIERGDVMLGVLPQFHSFGLSVMTLLPLMIGCTVVYTARFVPARLVALLRQYRPSVFVAIPSMYNALLSAKSGGPDEFRSVRYLVSGGEPLPDVVATRFRERFGTRVNEGFGMTETAAATNWCRPEEYREHSVGRALPGVRERIVDIATGADLPPGQEGELRIAGPNVMKGYYNLPAETAAAFDERGFLRTGDMARIDVDGHLFITGRLKEMLIVGGENVFPREIEDVLNRHPAVADSGVTGIMDPTRGELPVGFVELREGRSATGRDLVAWCREHLAGYKAPREVVILDKLPRNATGKILRRELKKLVPPVESGSETDR